MLVEKIAYCVNRRYDADAYDIIELGTGNKFKLETYVDLILHTNAYHFLGRQSPDTGIIRDFRLLGVVEMTPEDNTKKLFLKCLKYEKTKDMVKFCDRNGKIFILEGTNFRPYVSGMYYQMLANVESDKFQESDSRLEIIKILKVVTGKA